MSKLPSPIIVVGIGELGSVFSRGFLRVGHPVVPVLRSTSFKDAQAKYPAPELVLVTVPEDELEDVLLKLPHAWRSRVALLQNELLPEQWLRAGIEQPTVAVVWFEKKAGRPVHDVRSTVLAGPRVSCLERALSALHIPHRTVADSELLSELVAKNLYILALNLAGLEVDGAAGDLLTRHRSLLDTLVREIIELQRALVGPDLASRLDDQVLRKALENAINSDPSHGCAGRSAVRRLQRNLGHARRLGLELDTFERLGRAHLPSSSSTP